MDPSKQKKTRPTTITAETVLNKIIHDYLQCCICMSTFTDPTFLECHHTFCRSCLHDLFQSESYNRQKKINCPTCRKATTLVGQGTSGLQQNFTLASLADDVEHQMKLLSLQQGTLICSLCDDESRAIIQCVDCNMLLCQDCWFEEEATHTKHEVNVLKTPTEKVPKCSKHPDSDQYFYCQDCKTLLCAMCAATKHQSHVYVSTDEAEISLKKEISDLISEADEQIQGFVQERSLAENKRDEMEAAIKSELTEVNRKRHAICIDDAFQALCQKLLSNVHCKRKAKYSEILEDISAKVDWATHTLDQIQKQVAEVSKFKLLQMGESFVVRIKDVVEKDFPPIDYPSDEINYF